MIAIYLSLAMAGVLFWLLSFLIPDAGDVVPVCVALLLLMTVFDWFRRIR